MVFTVLQPAMFMQDLAGTWPAVARSGQIAMPFSKRAKVCYVDYRDVAEAASNDPERHVVGDRRASRGRRNH